MTDTEPLSGYARRVADGIPPSLLASCPRVALAIRLKDCRRCWVLDCRGGYLDSSQPTFREVFEYTRGEQMPAVDMEFIYKSAVRVLGWVAVRESVCAGGRGVSVM